MRPLLPTVDAFPLFGRQFLADRMCHIVYRGVLAQLLDLLILRHCMEPDAGGDLAIHAHHRRDFLFREKQNLEHQVIAFFGASTHP